MASFQAFGSKRSNEMESSADHMMVNVLLCKSHNVLRVVVVGSFDR